MATATSIFSCHDKLARRKDTKSEVTVVGIIFAIVSSAWFGISNVGLRRGALTGSALQGLFITVLMGVPFFLIAAIVSGQIFRYQSISLTNYMVLAFAGILHYVVGRYTIIRAVDAIGVTRATPMMQASIIIAVATASIFLSEQVTPLMIFGIALVMIGPAIAVQKSSPKSIPTSPKESDSFQPRLMEGYLWGSVNSLVFGITPILVRYALDDSGPGFGVLGGFVAYTAAGAFLLPGLAAPNRIKGILKMDQTSQRWFIFVSFSIFLAQMFWFLSLSRSPVSIVMPLMRAGSVFGILFSFLLSRKVESFSPQVLSGIAISIVGAVIVLL
jgi:drug/metabolite transporter (DMT)-like permease